MIYPKFIKKGDCIGVPTPSDGAYDDVVVNRFKNANKKFEELGYKLKLSKYLFNSEKARSSTEINRANELNEMFEDDKIDAIWCAAGGEFLVEILPYVDFEKLVENPKWVVGFSDPTGILFPLTTKYDVSTMYGNNFKSFGMQEYHKSLTDNLEMINGNLIVQENYELFENEHFERVTGLEGYNLTEKVEWKTLDNNPVEVTGRIIGGCFDIIDELAGTKFDGTSDFIERYKDDGIIWFFDNCDFTKEQLIRKLWKFEQLGYFKNTKAIIFGRCGNDNSNIGYNMEDTLKDSVISKIGVPIIYDADISHKGPSMTIINGAIAKVECKDGKGKIEFELR